MGEVGGDVSLTSHCILYYKSLTSPLYQHPPTLLVTRCYEHRQRPDPQPNYCLSKPPFLLYYGYRSTTFSCCFIETTSRGEVIQYHLTSVRYVDINMPLPFCLYCIPSILLLPHTLYVACTIPSMLLVIDQDPLDITYNSSLTILLIIPFKPLSYLLNPSLSPFPNSPLILPPLTLPSYPIPPSLLI